MLGKNLNPTGMYNRPPHANQPITGLRQAVNVYKTYDGRIVPRSDSTDPFGGMGSITGIRYTHALTKYDTDILSFVSYDATESNSGLEKYAVYKTTAAGASSKIPQSGDLGMSPFQFPGIGPSPRTQDYSNQVQTYRVNNTVYFFDPYYGMLSKYDGVQVCEAGTPQPRISSPDLVTSGNTHHIRVVQHTLDFDNNEPVSEYVQFRVSSSTTTLNIDSAPAINMIGNGAVAPTNVISTKIWNRPYFVGTAVYNAGTLDFSVTTTLNAVTSASIGSYLLVSINYVSSAINGLPGDSLAIALKIKSVSGATVVLDATSAKYLDMNREWQTATISGVFAAGIAFGCTSFLTVWASSSANGIYYFRGQGPSYGNNTTGEVFTVDISTVTAAITTGVTSEKSAATISPALNDWYDVTTRKLHINSFYPFGDLRSLTKYQDLFYLSGDDLIWISDFTLGGSVEQFLTSGFIRVGDKEFGANIAICGTQDFLYVGRERKNYYLNGNIPTGNYKVQEVTEADVGPYSPNTAINIKDSVILLTCQGVYQIMSGGRASELSKDIASNFFRFDSLSANDTLLFQLAQKNIYYTSDIRTADTNYGMQVCHDEFRNLLIFVNLYENTKSLVMNTDTGEFFEWYGMGGATDRKIAVTSLNGKFYFAKNPAINTYKVNLYDEDPTSVSFLTTAPARVMTTWLTAGEPSLEKQALQLKIFGRIITTTASQSVKVYHYKDWNRSTLITNSTYAPVLANATTQFSHKKRLTSDKALAVSVGIEVDDEIKFEIESLEVEFEPIQQGMKR
jgi:hypothetical protein